MRADILQIALIAGACTWAFRFFPTRADMGRLAPDGILARLLAALGPAAIAALFTAEILPHLTAPLGTQLPLAGGVIGTCLAYLLRRSVVGATLAGSATFGLVLALLGH